MHMPFITPSAAMDCPMLRRDFPAEAVRRATLEITGLGRITSPPASTIMTRICVCRPMT